MKLTNPITRHIFVICIINCIFLSTIVMTSSGKIRKMKAAMGTEAESTVFEFLQRMRNREEKTTPSPNPTTPSAKPTAPPATSNPPTTSDPKAGSTPPVTPTTPVTPPTQPTSQPDSQNAKKTYIKNLNDPGVQLSDWLSISSNAFSDPTKFPTLGESTKIKTGSEMQRLNEKHTQAMSEGSTYKNNFWFKIRGGYIYYFASKEDINILGSILISKIENSNRVWKIAGKKSNKNATPTPTSPSPSSTDSTSLETCFNVYDKSNDKFEICAESIDVKYTWLCSIQSFLSISDSKTNFPTTQIDPKCDPTSSQAKVNLNKSSSSDIELKKITQPVIIIPLASRKCNEDFNYNSKGLDWECSCVEGRSQSPIDLPVKSKATLSNLKPMFQYTLVSSVAREDTLDGLVSAGENIKIRYDRGAIRIHHPNMGKIVTEDGGVFAAEEIIFHTPSEHTINGERMDLEMQVIHYGKSKGDIAKQVVLSFLFKAKPGVYNKLLDKLDFFNLPNPVDTFRDINNDFFIPSVLLTTEDDDVSAMPPFSFYSYEGSITAPPCTERTVHHVASDPIYLSNTVISLFKEALKTPETTNEKGEVVQAREDAVENYRETQPLNGRKVYFFDHEKFDCPQFKKTAKKREIKPAGHYEKRQVDTMQYIYVNGDNASGIPGSFVVSENEAKGDGKTQ